ncbi:hypothetical protein BH24ACT9_BH24ACT9_01010 [soil metagenome]
MGDQQQGSGEAVHRAACWRHEARIWRGACVPRRRCSRERWHRTHGQRLITEEQPAGLVDLTDRDARPETGRSLVWTQPAEQDREQSCLAGAVRAGEQDPVTPVDLRGHRSQRELRPLYECSVECGHHRATARGGGYVQPQLPLLAASSPSRVDLPEPFAPIRPTTSPGLRTRSRSENSRALAMGGRQPACPQRCRHTLSIRLGSRSIPRPDHRSGNGKRKTALLAGGVLDLFGHLFPNLAERLLTAPPFGGKEKNLAHVIAEPEIVEVR